MVNEIYTAPPAINYKLTFGPLISPVYADFNRIRYKAPIFCLLNTHSPEFNSSPITNETIDELIRERKKEYNLTGIVMNYFRDDQYSEQFTEALHKLEENGILKNNIFDIQKAKNDLDNSIVSFDSENDFYSFREYLNQKEDMRDLRRNLNYGLEFKGNKISQVFEQILFASMSNNSKLIVSGRNIAGAYSFQVPLLHQYFSKNPIHISFHSLAKFKNNNTSTASQTLSLEELHQYNTNKIPFSSFIRYVISKAFENKDVTKFQEQDLIIARKTLIKFQNLCNIMKSDCSKEKIDFNKFFIDFREHILKRSRCNDISLEKKIMEMSNYLYI